MKSILLAIATFGALTDLLTAGDSSIKVIDQPGEYSISGQEMTVKIWQEDNGLIQYRIRNSGPAEPQIKPGSDWFIAVVDENQFWVHLGKGRLLRYTWQSESKSRTDEMTYPRIDEAELPPEVIDRLEAAVERDRDQRYRGNLLETFRGSSCDARFANLKQAEISTETQAEKAAATWLSQEHGLLAEENLTVAGLFQASRRNREGEAAPGWLWEVRVYELGMNLSGVILVDATSGQVFSAVPEKPRS